MKNFEEISILGRGKPKPPKQHESYDTPEGALYIGYTAVGKEFLYTEAELAMFEKLKGVYTNIPTDDPYASSPAFPMEIERIADSRDRVVFQGKEYLLGKINEDPINYPKPNFDAFRNFSEVEKNIQTLSTSQGTKRAVSVSEIAVMDVISEGEIEGLVSYEYSYSVAKLGQIGYTTAVKTDFAETTLPNGSKVRYLPSIHFNGIPIVDQDGKFNFQQIDVNVTNGKPGGDENGVQVSQFGTIKDISDQPLQVIRKIGERLRGPNRRPGGAVEENEPGFFSKFYKILNRNCDGVKIFIRMDAIYEQNVSGPRFEPVANGSGYGDKKPVQVGFGVSFRKLFADQASGGFSKSFDFPIIAKLANGFIFEFRMPFHKTQQDLEDPLFQGYEIKITRYTPDSITQTVQNRSTIDAIGEIYHQKFSYPNTALISAKFISEYFSQLPERSYDVRLLKVKIPSNYDPVTKTYNGDWDGLFLTRRNITLGIDEIDKKWTDNPAWCYYDLLTNARYGLGDHVKEEDVDKWTIYELSKYCDEMVSDGEGGFEPRYVCNVRLSEKSDAYNALKNFTSIFRGFTYYMGGSLLCTFDAKRDVIYSFTNSNVKDGSFSYQGSPSNTRGNVFLVRYNDEDNFFEPAIEYLEDPAGIKRNGIIQKDVNAFGCTKKSYALRYAKWMKETENTEIETVTFAAGIESMLLRPGDVINISDRNRYSRRLGGRIFTLLNSGSKASVMLDSVIPITGNGNYSFTLATPTFNFETSLISTGIAVTGGNNIFVATGESGGLSSHFISGIRKPHLQTKTFTRGQTEIITGLDGSERTQIIFTSPFIQSEFLISGRNPFFITSNSVSDSIPQKVYRIISIKEDDASNYGVQALEINNEKYNAIDSGVAIINERALPLTPQLQLSLQRLTDSISTNVIKSIGYKVIPNPVGTVNNRSYSVFTKKGAWIGSDFSQNIIDDTPPTTSYLVDTIYPANGMDATPIKYYIPDSDGKYEFRAYARNGRGAFCSIPASGFFVVTDQEKLISLVTISSLIPKDEVFFSSAIGVTDASQLQKLIDVNTGNKPGSKITIGPSYATNYGNLGEKELISLAREPLVSWQAGLPVFTDKEVFLDRAGIFYRITAREPSPTNAPSKFIYFETTGFSNATDGGNLSTLTTLISYLLNKSGVVTNSSSARVFNSKGEAVYPSFVGVGGDEYTFPTKAQLSPGPYQSFYADFSQDNVSGNKGPFRNYDVVVEAHDRVGFTSTNYQIKNAEKIGADGRWILGGSNGANPKGYDIIEVRNPRPAQTIFTPDLRYIQAKESMLPASEVSNSRRSDYFSMFRLENGSAIPPSAKQFVRQPDIEDNYPTLKLLGANDNEPTLCVTQQFFELNGNLTLKIKRDARGFSDPKQMTDFRGVSYALILYSDKWFNSNTIKSGAANRFSASATEPDVYNYLAYGEQKPIESKIIKSNVDNFVPKSSGPSANCEAYVSSVRAKVIDLRDNDQFIDEGVLIMDVEINNKQYVSVSLVDAIDADRDEIVLASDRDLALLKRSKFYNFSPAALIIPIGEPDKKTGFRAYASIRTLCITGPLGIQQRLTHAGTFPVGLYPVRIPSSGYIQVPFSQYTVKSCWGGWGVFCNTNTFSFPASAVPTYYYPHIVQLQVFAHGVKDDIAIVEITTDSGEIGFHLTFTLEEKIPTFNRLLFFGGLARKAERVSGVDDENTVTVTVMIPSLQQPPGFNFSPPSFSPKAAADQRKDDSSKDPAGVNFRAKFNIKNAGAAFIYELPTQSFFALVSNGLKDATVFSQVGSDGLNGITLPNTNTAINSRFFQAREGEF